MTTMIWTDGSCIRPGGTGGWAWAIEGGREDSGYAPSTTNQRMELTAVLEAVKANNGDLEIVSDSAYVVNCFNQRWWPRWEANGWRNAARQPVGNRDLWEPLLVHTVHSDRTVRFTHVRGHSGVLMNEYVDRLAYHARVAGA